MKPKIFWTLQKMATKFFTKSKIIIPVVIYQEKNKQTNHSWKWQKDFPIENLIFCGNLPPLRINMDETPMYWEYLPRRVIHRKGTKVISSIKTGFEYRRSTLTLACSAFSNVLKPALILRRKRPYELGCSNHIQIFLQKSDNGWQNSGTMKE